MSMVYSVNEAPQRSTNSAGGQSRVQASSPEAKKLRKAATEFESMLLSSWWASLKQSGLPGGEDDSDPGKETLDQLGMQAMSAAVAKGGGIGIGNMLVKSLLHSVGATGKGMAKAGLGHATSDRTIG